MAALTVPALPRNIKTSCVDGLCLSVSVLVSVHWRLAIPLDAQSLPARPALYIKDKARHEAFRIIARIRKTQSFVLQGKDPARQPSSPALK